MITLYVDADACPVTREAISHARAHRVPVVLIGNEAQSFARYEGKPGVELAKVATGRDSADFAIVGRLAPGDIVVTNDTGLAAMALGRGAHPISPRGRVFSLLTIDAELEVRHAEQRLRRAGGRTRGPAPFEEEDRESFGDSLERLLRELTIER